MAMWEMPHRARFGGLWLLFMGVSVYSIQSGGGRACNGGAVIDRVMATAGWLMDVVAWYCLDVDGWLMEIPSESWFTYENEGDL